MFAVFLHQAPYHLHDGVTVLQVVSWTAIGGGGIALALSWGRIIAWLREDEVRPAPRFVRWGNDDGGWFAEVRHLPPGEEWMAEFEDGTLRRASVSRGGRTSWLRVGGSRQPCRLIGDGGSELELPGSQ